jgi:hypothetical protein
MLVMLLAMLPILFAQRAVAADYTYGVYAAVPSPLPTSAPRITNIPDGKVVTTNDSFTVSGTCQNSMQVKIFKNGVLAGSTLCKAGAFSLSFDLFLGANILTARDYNADGVAGPESAPLTVKLVPQNLAAGNAALTTNQFFITSDAYYRGTSSGKAISWLITLAGGQAPYVVNVSWGDGKTDEVDRGIAGQFKISHVYNAPAQSNGNYTVVVQAKDQVGENALLQLVAVVPSGSGTATTVTDNGGHGTWFTSATALQTLGTMVLIVISFWIGERYELQLLKRQHIVGIG